MPSILIVDGDADARDLYTFCLRSAGFRTTAVETGPLALDSARREPPDAVLADLRLSGFDGIELARRFRAQTLRAPIMLVTGWVSPEMEARAREAGIAQVVLKPCTPDELVDRVRQLIGQPT